MPILNLIDPIALSLGPVQVHWYGLMYLLGFGSAYWLGLRRAREGRLGLDAEQFSDLMFYAMLGVILGGRLGYMLVYGWREWIDDPLALLRVWQGGMSFHGGLVGVMLAVWLWARRRRIALWDALDFVSPLVPPGLAFGRLGNYIGGELWGRHTDLPWGVVFPRAPELEGIGREALLAMHKAGELNAFARHPSQLYEALLEGVLLFALVYGASRRPRPRYLVSGLFALGYGLSRFAIEFVREPDAQLGYLAFGWLTMGQVLSLPLVALGITLLWLSRRQPAPAVAAS